MKGEARRYAGVIIKLHARHEIQITWSSFIVFIFTFFFIIFTTHISVFPMLPSRSLVELSGLCRSFLHYHFIFFFFFLLTKHQPALSTMCDNV